MRKMRFWARLCFPFFAIAAYAAIAKESPVDRIHACFQLDEKHFVLGEPIWITYSLTNQTNKGIRFTIGNNMEDSFVFSVEPSQEGDFEDVSTYFPFGGLTLEERLGPGRTFSRKILLTENIWFKKPGKYRITCKAMFAITDDEGVPQKTANAATIDLTIREDTESLARIVKQIGQQYRHNNADIRTEVVRALSTVRRPFVLSYLRDTLQDKDELVIETALKGIYNVGNAEAKDILNKYAHDHKGTYLGKLSVSLSERLKGSGDAQ